MKISFKYLAAAFLSVIICLPAHAQTTTFFHNDAVGSPVMATDESGNTLWKENYRPYGEKLVNATENSNDKIGYVSKPYDRVTGLTYMGARYYDPALGRFISTDPVGVDPSNIHSFNRYAYANNNPYRYVDPDGRAAIALPAVVGGIALAMVINNQSPEGRAQNAAIAGRIWRAVANVFRSDSAEANSNSSSGEKPSLVDEKGERHILDSDKTGGGHRAGTGKPGKSEFPASWSDEKIIGEISDVATDPGSKHGIGDNGNQISEGRRDGVDIRVVRRPDSQGGRIITGYPINVDRNPKR